MNWLNNFFLTILTFCIVSNFVFESKQYHTFATEASIARDKKLDPNWNRNYIQNDAAFSNTPAENVNYSRRIILAYRLEGCEPTNDAIRGHSSTQILQGRHARDVTMKDLQRKTMDYLMTIRSQKFSSKEQAADRLEGYAENVPDSPEEPLKSRYLESLQMEVILGIPDEMRDTDLKALAESLPCVHRAYQDENKYGSSANQESKLKNSDPTNSPAAVDPLERKAESLGEEIIAAYEAGSFCSRPYCAAQSPDDALFPLQWNLHEKEKWSIQAQKAWNLWTGASASVTVAIIDSGCNLVNPELSSKLWNNPGEICGDGIDNDGNGYVDDCYGWDFVDNDNTVEPAESGHGTAAASIIAAASDNTIGIAGICWGCKIMCLKFIGKNQGTVSNQVQAIDYAVRKGARISNNSYGGYGYAEIEFEAIKRAQLAGHLFITSAGNNNLDTDLPRNDHTPSSYPLANIISVAASSPSGQKAFFSNFGRKTVHLVAPGIDIQAINSDGQYVPMSGTSFAAPHATAAAALLWSAFPSLSFEAVKKVLMQGCKKSTALTNYAECGGVLDIFESMIFAAKLMRGDKEAELSEDINYFKFSIN